MQATPSATVPTAPASLVAGQRMPWNAAAIWSLILGVVELPMIGIGVWYGHWTTMLFLIPSFFAAAIGQAALKQINADQAKELRGKTPAVIGLILGYMGVLLAVVLGAVSVIGYTVFTLAVVVVALAAFFTYRGLTKPTRAA